MMKGEEADSPELSHKAGNNHQGMRPEEPSDNSLTSERTREDEQEQRVHDGAGDDDLGMEKTKSVAETLSLPHEVAFVATICMAQFTTRKSTFIHGHNHKDPVLTTILMFIEAGLGQTLSILHVIGDSFGITDPGVLSWLIAGYSLTVGTFILFSGRLGDVYGYKKMLLIGFAWFSVWSMVAGLSVYSNHVLFVFARVLSGIGPAITLPNGLAIFGASYKPGPRKAMVFSLFGAMAPNGSIVGSVFGGLFALAWWPWTFWSFAIALAGLVVVGYFVIPDPPQKKPSTQSVIDVIKELDIPGALTGVIGLVLINFAWNQAPIVGWQEPYTYVCLIIGFIFVGVFFFIELKLASNPLIPFHALNNDVSFVLSITGLGWSCFGIWVYYIWSL